MSHKQRIINLTDKLDNALLSFQQQIENLANNDLIINSIVDYSNRDNYLPIFFRSLKLNNNVETSIVFTDFTGKYIAGNNISSHKGQIEQFNWQETVLTQGVPYFEHSKLGLFIAVPVLLSDSPEGAIFSYISNVQQLIPTATSSSTLIYISENNEVLYSSNSQLIAYGSIYSDKSFRFWSKKISPYLSGDIVSIEPPISAYGNILWLAIVIIVSLLFIFFGLRSNIKSTARYASLSMKELHRTLAEAITKEGEEIQFEDQHDEATEFIAIRKEFYTVLNNSFKKTISIEKFTSVINSLGEALIVLDHDKNIILNNNSFHKLCNRLGFSMPQDVMNIFPKKHLELDEKNTTFEIEYPINIKNKNDNTIIVQWSASPYVDDKKKILGVIFVGKDISFAKRLESELLFKNQAIDEAQTSIIITDAKEGKHSIIYANKAFYYLTGFSVHDIIGKNCRFLQGPKTKESDIKKIKTAINSQKAIRLTLTNYKKDGSEFQNELTINPIANEHGVITHFLGIQLDVTEREATANYLRLAKQKAEESTKLKSEFLASMSHEIRTPMNGVIGMLDSLLRGQLNSEQQHNAEIAKNSAHSLLNIINDILDFSKIESGKLEIENVSFNLLTLFEDVALAQARLVHDKGIELIIDTTAIDTPLVEGDPGRVRQVLNNLLSNAIKFTEEGEVTVSAKLTKHSEHIVKLHARVSDTGIGIAPNRLAEVFKSFTQADSSTTRLYGGTGLGLAITSKLCELMNGSVNATSQENVGSCFNFDIALGISNSIEKQPPFKIHNISILILDENESSACVLKKQLQKWGGTVVDLKKEGFIKQIEKSNFDLVFIDYSFADNSAINVVGSLPKSVKEKTAFILTSKTNENLDKELIIDVGFRYLLSKPATTDKLKLMLESVLYNRAPASVERLKTPIFKENTHQTDIPVLLVEDNHTNQLVAKKVLSELGCEITIANNGREAIDILNEAQAPFKLIFMDCQMPILDGYQTTEKIRAGDAGKQNSTIPIIAMTANAMKGDKEKCLLHGMDDYVSKPINIDTLRAKINSWYSYKD